MQKYIRMQSVTPDSRVFLLFRARVLNPAFQIHDRIDVGYRSVSRIRFEQHYRLLGSIFLDSMKVIFPASNEGRAMHGQRHF